MKKTNIVLWIVQVALAALFLFAGVMKLVTPAEALAAQSGGFSVLFLRFIGLAEALGALGLLLPGLTRIQTQLTPLAAAGLVIIMLGAVVTTAQTGAGLLASIPLAIGVLCGFVAYGRWRVVPHLQRAR